VDKIVESTVLLEKLRLKSASKSEDRRIGGKMSDEGPSQGG
jgi:hypothetical protein